MKSNRVIKAVVLSLLFVPWASANHLAITNVSLDEVSGGYAEVSFDISWENSWRASWTEVYEMENWDAAWVFVKYRFGGGLWTHALLAMDGHTPAAGTVIDVASNDGTNAVGVFIYRDAEGSGTLTAGNIRLRWDYTANGLAGTNAVDISIHGIEMVYIPEGAFKLGSGGNESRAFYRYPDPATPYTVSSEAEISVGQEDGVLYYSPHTDAGDGNGPIPAAFPKGYQAFYAMKYEVTQGQYVDFLNLLEPGMAGARFPNRWDQYGHRISVSNGVYWTDTPDRACNYLTREHAAMYLDWAALRPMTELEFEKLCRGPLQPVPNEYAWGGASAIWLDGFDGVDGSGAETATPVNANSHFANQPTSLRRPVRVGIFAREATTRWQAGAGYYGNMELSGNVMERMISAGRDHGRAFDGTHGDGNVGTLPATWPTSNSGYGQRGSSFWYLSTANDHPISDRRWAARDSYLELVEGVRGVRTAP